MHLFGLTGGIASGKSAVAARFRERGVPVTPRGAGTSLAGQTVGPGVILDMSRHMKSPD